MWALPFFDCDGEFILHSLRERVCARVYVVIDVCSILDVSSSLCERSHVSLLAQPVSSENGLSPQ